MTHIRRVGNFDNNGGRNVLEEITTDLKQAIAYFVAKDWRAEMVGLGNEEKLVAAVDILALMAEHYHLSIEVNDTTVRRWRDICLQMFDQRSGFNPEVDTSGWKRDRRQIIANAFARLEAMAVLYPPFSWAGEEENH